MKEYSHKNGCFSGVMHLEKDPVMACQPSDGDKDITLAQCPQLFTKSDEFSCPFTVVRERVRGEDEEPGDPAVTVAWEVNEIAPFPAYRTDC